MKKMKRMILWALDRRELLKGKGAVEGNLRFYIRYSIANFSFFNFEHTLKFMLIQIEAHTGILKILAKNVEKIFLFSLFSLSSLGFGE